MFTFTDMAAVVICFDATMRVGSVDVKSIQVSTYGVDRGEVLLMKFGVKEMRKGDSLGKRMKSRPTCASKAPVSRTLFLVERGVLVGSFVSWSAALMMVADLGLILVMTKLYKGTELGSASPDLWKVRAEMHYE